MICVVAAILRRGQSVLIARRAAGQKFGGFWEFPGGKIEEGETPEACLQRELREELALDVRVGEFVARSVHAHPSGSIELVAYEAHVLAGDWQLSVHDQLEWVVAERLLDFPLAPADVDIARCLMGDRASAWQEPLLKRSGDPM